MATGCQERADSSSPSVPLAPLLTARGAWGARAGSERQLTLTHACACCAGRHADGERSAWQHSTLASALLAPNRPLHFPDHLLWTAHSGKLRLWPCECGRPHSRAYMAHGYTSSAWGDGLSARTAGLQSAFVVAVRDCFSSPTASSLVAATVGHQDREKKEVHQRMLEMLQLADRAMHPPLSSLPAASATCGRRADEDTADAEGEHGGVLTALQPLAWHVSGGWLVGGRYSASILTTVAGRYSTSVVLVAGAFPSRGLRRLPCARGFCVDVYCEQPGACL